VTKAARIPRQPKPKKREKKGLSKKHGKKNLTGWCMTRKLGKCSDKPLFKKPLIDTFQKKKHLVLYFL